MANSVIRLNLSELASTAALGVNLTNADIVSKIEAGTSGFSDKGGTDIGGICTDFSGNIYVSDCTNHIIYKISEGGRISVLAGSAGVSGRNGTLTKVAALDARFNTPRGLSCDKSGNIYVADSGNNQIRVIHQGFVSHLAGKGDGSSGFVDGVGGSASFNNPVDVAVDRKGAVFVADKNNHSIRRVTSGTVITYAGDSSGDKENVSVTSNDIFSFPSSVAIDNNNRLFVCDSGNYKIKMIVERGWVYLFSGSGTQGKIKGTTAFNGRFYDLQQSDVDNSGNLYVVDNNDEFGSRVILINSSGIQKIAYDFTAATNYNTQVRGVAVSPAGKLFVAVSGITDPEFESSSSSSSFGYSESSSTSSFGYSESSSSSGA